MAILYIKLRNWFYNVMQLQFLLSLISLPILIAWGLPFSLMTVLGNLLFTPLLSVFLLCCSCIFFLELLSLPNGFIITVLEKLFVFWMHFLEYGSPQWLSGIDLSGLVVALVCALCACIILQHRSWGRPRKSWYLFALLLLIPFGYQKIIFLFPKTGCITCLRKTVRVSCYKGKISIIDKGALGEKQIPGTWIQYTFLSEILKRWGTTSFKNITCANPSVRTLEALITLCQHAPISQILLRHPYRKSRDYKQRWNELEKICSKQKIKLDFFTEESTIKSLYP